MTENEKELVRIIWNSENPQETLMTAIKIITRYLQQTLDTVERTI